MHRIDIGEKAYSSLSLCGWLMLDAFGLPFQEVTPSFEEMRAGTAPARTAPIWQAAWADLATRCISTARPLRNRSGCQAPVGISIEHEGEDRDSETEERRGVPAAKRDAEPVGGRAEQRNPSGRPGVAVQAKAGS